MYLAGKFVRASERYSKIYCELICSINIHKFTAFHFVISMFIGPAKQENVKKQFELFT